MSEHVGDSMDILREPGELWWGGAVADGDDMPFESRFGRDLAQWVGDNQASPVLVSSTGRYVWGEKSLSFGFDGSHLRVDGGGGRVVVGRGGSCLREAFVGVSGRFFGASGVLPDVRLFAGPQYNTWIELVYEQSQERVLEYARGVVKAGFPAGVVMIDDNWQEDYGVWEFHAGRFPDPAGMVGELRALGFAVMLWVCPFVSADSGTFRELERRGFLVRGADGVTAVRRWWNGFSGVLDLSNPGAVEWVHGRLESLRSRFGVEGFKFDAGDPRFYRADDVTFASTSPNEQCEAWARVGLRYPLNEFRAGWKNAGQPLGQRLKDTVPTWGRGGLASLIPHAITQGLAGYAFNCPDMIGGGLAEDFESEGYAVDQELIVRWTQASALFPMMQFSLAPWRVLDDEHLAHVTAAIDTRTHLTPYILDLARHAADTGEPLLRNLEYVFPHQGLARITDQFMLGDDILVAPVLTPHTTQRTIHFPPGTWTSPDGTTITGPATHTIPTPLHTLPWYTRTTP